MTCWLPSLKRNVTYITETQWIINSESWLIYTTVKLRKQQLENRLIKVDLHAKVFFWVSSHVIFFKSKETQQFITMPLAASAQSAQSNHFHPMKITVEKNSQDRCDAFQIQSFLSDIPAVPNGSINFFLFFLILAMPLVSPTSESSQCIHWVPLSVNVPAPTALWRTEPRRRAL